MDILYIEHVELGWCRNLDGLGNFGDLQPIAIIDQVANRTKQIISADFDNDGDSDVAVSSYSDPTITWFENLDGIGTFGTSQSVAENVIMTTHLISGDIDGNGTIDILSASDENKIAWHKNMGTSQNEINGIVRIDDNGNGCDSSDSRVPAEDLMGMKPGELFVHRNVANIVNAIDLNAQSVINYAVTHIKVNHIIVCGHYNCGGVKAAMEAKDLGILNPWLRNIRDVYREHKDEISQISDSVKKYDRLVELNVYEQTINVIKMAAVQRVMRTRNMQIHGWVFDMRTGSLIDLKIDFKKILDEIMEIYRLDE